MSSSSRYHRPRNLESNYNRIPKYPSPSHTGSLSRVPVRRLVSQTRLEAELQRSAAAENRRPVDPRAVMIRGPRQRSRKPEGRDTVFLHQIFTHFYWVLNPFEIIMALAILSLGSVTRSLRNSLVSHVIICHTVFCLTAVYDNFW